MKDSCVELGFNIGQRAGANDPYADDDQLRLVNLGLIAFFDKYSLTSSSGKEIEKIKTARVICLMHKLISSGRDSDDLSIGFHRSNEARERKLTNNETTKGKYPFRIFF